MKLLRIKILGENFRSLTANRDYKFNWTNDKNIRMSNKVFAGLNGSGKSNFLELIAEVFYFLEKCNLKTTPEEYRNSKNIGFEIEYILPLKKNVFNNLKLDMVIDGQINLFKAYDGNFGVRILKKINEAPEFSFFELDKNIYHRIDSNTSSFLPSKIIAYTSGQNELLSNPFIRLKYQYFNDLKFSNYEKPTERLFYLSQESNSSIFVAILLLADSNQLRYFKKLFGFEDLSSFRITFNYKHNTKEAVKLFETKKSSLDSLKACATSWIDNTSNKCLTLDFEINKATHDSFKHFYRSPLGLFKAFYDLESLNLLLDKTMTKKFILNAHKTINISDELAKPDPSDLFFRIEKIKLKKLKKDNLYSEIFYKSLSDGEHQFNEVIGAVLMMEEEGCLFLLDEPDTHFNPKWRAKMIEILNHVSAKIYSSEGIPDPDSIRKQEIIITTHSPFVISDSKREDVYKFERNDGELVIKNPDFETYGSSISFILESIFGRDITMSDFSYDELVKIRASIRTADDIKRVKKELLKFGESIEKFDTYTYLMEKEKEFEKNVN